MSVLPECPLCGDPMYADEAWRLRPGRVRGAPAEPGDYAHARCIALERNKERNRQFTHHGKPL